MQVIAPLYEYEYTSIETRNVIYFTLGPNPIGVGGFVTSFFGHELNETFSGVVQGVLQACNSTRQQPFLKPSTTVKIFPINIATISHQGSKEVIENCS